MPISRVLARPLAFAALLAVPAAARAQARVVTPAEAAGMVGKAVTVCGRVAGTRFLERGNRLTFLNFDRPFPEHSFTAVVLVSVRAQMRVPPEDRFLDQQVCVKGTVATFKEQPQIVVASLTQIWLKK